MRFWEIVADKLANTKIYEMAKSRQDAKTTVTGISYNLIDHIIKLYVFNSPSDVNHWKGEINGWIKALFKIRLKPNNKHPDKNTLYTWLVFDSDPHYSAEYVDEVVHILRDHDGYNAPLYDYDPEFVINEVLSIIDKICIDISNGLLNKIDSYL